MFTLNRFLQNVHSFDHQPDGQTLVINVHVDHDKMVWGVGIYVDGFYCLPSDVEEGCKSVVPQHQTTVATDALDSAVTLFGYAVLSEVNYRKVLEEVFLLHEGIQSSLTEEDFKAFNDSFDDNMDKIDSLDAEIKESLSASFDKVSIGGTVASVEVFCLIKRYQDLIDSQKKLIYDLSSFNKMLVTKGVLNE